QQALEQELVSAQEKIAELEKERTNLQKTNGEQQAQLRLMEEERKELRRASLASMPQVERGKNTKDEVFEPVHGPRISQQEVVELKKELQTSLAKLQQTIMQRKDLMDQVNRKNTGVKIQIQPLATGTGISLDQLRQQVSSLSSASDVGAIRGGIGEIQRKLNDDIGVLQRLAKM
ncbi:MAG TPA: hypothetical protein PLP17_13545, partial [Oligoflexia bacterium]|nr:hypothetical protein [Oligoflexia bacterium]